MICVVLIKTYFVASVPIMISMETHVSEMWTVDGYDAFLMAQSEGLIQRPKKGIIPLLPEPTVPEGLLVVLRLKSGVELAMTSFDDEKTITSRKSATQQNEQMSRIPFPNGDESSNEYDVDEVEEVEEGNGSAEADKDSDPNSVNEKSNSDKDVLSTLRRLMAFNPLTRSLPSYCGGDPKPNPEPGPLGTPLSAWGVSTGTSPEIKNSMHQNLNCHPTDVNSNATGESESEEIRDIAFFVPAGTRVYTSMTAALATWRAVLRMNDIPEHRGVKNRNSVADSGRKNEVMITIIQFFGHLINDFTTTVIRSYNV